MGTKKLRKRKLKLSVKVLLMVLLCSVVLCGTSAGTFAWLMDEADPLTNTFTHGDINIKLEETDTGLDQDDDITTNTYKMMPGEDIIKDPKVTVVQGSENCWLFVKLEKLNTFDDYMEYTVLTGDYDWKVLDAANHPGVYYRTVDASEVNNADKVFSVIQNDTVHVKGEVTKEMLNALTEETYPRLKVTAYAVQRNENIEEIDTAQEAWVLVYGQNIETE